MAPTKSSTPANSSVTAPLHIVSPLIPSPALSVLCGRSVLLKMDNLQPSGSFKIRGIGNYIQKRVGEGYSRVVSSSGGNAGMAAAYAARVLGIPATIIIPESTPQLMIPRLQQEEAEVKVHGRVWNSAHEEAARRAKDSKACLVHPFDHPDIWVGHSSIVSEILQQCGSERPAAIVVSVGGGGLLCGIMKGLHAHGVSDVAVVAMETVGADCFSAALEAGKPVSIGDITSVAKTLGALMVTVGVFELMKGVSVSSHVVTDREAIQACARFADDHRTLVEPACGAALAAGYSGIIKKLISDGAIPGEGPVVFVVCGGNMVTVDTLAGWKRDFNVE